MSFLVSSCWGSIPIVVLCLAFHLVRSDVGAGGTSFTDSLTHSLARSLVHTVMMISKPSADANTEYSDTIAE